MIKEIRNHRSHLVSAASIVRTRVRAVVVDPEVVFVASLMKADAPSLVASFQCDVTLWAEDDGTQKLRANLRELKVLACPFIRNKEEKAVTTVRSHVGSWGWGLGNSQQLHVRSHVRSHRWDHMQCQSMSRGVTGVT